MIHPDLQRYLDGEIPRDALPPELSQETGEWEALLASAAELRAERAPAWLEGRVMSTLSAQPAPSLWRTAWGWLLHPQPVRLRPIGVMLAGAAALLLFWIWPGARPPLPGAGAAGPGAAAQFT
ncbi:MAG: hypothetical protein HY703_13895, partial [Gemmatimonadetes bacterium]|nr:hypothetical protein [Gemmatimonadota bacterium]